MCADAFRDLPALAGAARSSAHAPYSGFAVGAALRTSDGRTFSGCNVENASYGLSICAERAAVFEAVAGGMRPGELAAIAVVADAAGPVTPCGACRQVIAEFAAADCEVVCANLAGESIAYKLIDLLPHGFRLG